ncbi:MAG TPA: hypothetical protein VGI64_22965 [Streptosporangiaceae bacterium]|jgi:hypothetical protein
MTAVSAAYEGARTDGARIPAGPTAGVIDAGFNTDSCTGSAAKHTLFCLGGGFALGAKHTNGLTEVSTGNAWTARAPMQLPATKNREIFANEVSCVAAGAGHSCVMVGDHFNGASTDTQLAELWTGKWRILTAANPPGATLSALDDVSCTSTTFCMMVGQAGGLRTMHATAYSWNGKQLKRLQVPAPAKTSTAILGGLSCASRTSCVAVGGFSKGSRFLAYAATWNGHGWKVRKLPNASGQSQTFLEGVSCPRPGQCVAVGIGERPGDHTFALRLSGGAWRILRTPKRADSSLIGVDCPAVSRCFAAGTVGRLSLAETWNGHSWTVQRTPRTGAPFNGTQLLHVSCVSTVRCEAVGSRYNPKNLQRTLAESWNGHSWQIQRTASP